MGPFFPRQAGRQATKRIHAHHLWDFTSTPLQWLPVLSHIAPPGIRRSEATAKFIRDIQVKPYLPVYEDIFHHPASRLKSHRPIWSIDTGSSVEELWRESWEVKPLVNSFIIDDPTALVPGFNLPRREWCLLNRFRTGTGQCAASLLQWRYTDNPLCICGNTQSMSHIVNDCPVKKFEGGLPVVRIRQFKHKKYLIS